ncbi:hypothetical protein G9C85_08245 [Halorubellus sp. JP-L1]|uniref:hypothetical protein n=1 Tax=Halorubellus sp. JP-L1 TaxID=2715753 RepID=UPI00140CBD9D|nr:hypothetical protein [Halorubellus sp. JP-L1]NHN41625.1 hypothetical protein [Halorubellus sp. JP-L1]
MRRRALLRTTAATTALGAIAGCLDGSGDDDSETETTATDDGTTTPATESTTTTPALEVTSRDIQTESTDCGSENAGSIEFTDSGADISGSVPANTPCYEAQYVNERVLGGVVEVTVGIQETDAENCQSCLGQIEYAGTLETNRDPHSLVLIHEFTPEGEDEPVTQVVADKTRDD